VRAVLDCNVIISSALTSNNIPFKVIRFLEEKHVLLASESTMEEFSKTILKAKFDKYFNPLDTRMEIISRYAGKVEWIKPVHIIRICRDVKDNQYLELALSGNADCIITGDPDLLVLHPFENISIISPKEFLDRFI
jgi:putative PIN family toxin of toxin-antitoxin system